VIPKIIHCFWAGAEKTELAERCRESWRRFASDCEVREWSLSDFPDMPEFCREAVRRHRWAFVSDWVRFKVLHDEGGIYLDWDEELVNELPTEMFKEEWCAGEYTASGVVGYAPGAGLALAKGSAVASAMLRHYDSAAFDGKTTVGEILGGMSAVKVLPPEVMSPMGMDGKVRRTDRTVGIHWYAMSWASPKMKVLRWLSWHGARGLIDFALRLRRVWRRS